MNLENAAYAILGLFGVALGLFFLINGFEGSGGDEQVMMGMLLMFVGFYCLNSRFFRIGQWEDGENAEPQISENIIVNLSTEIMIRRLTAGLFCMVASIMVTLQIPKDLYEVSDGFPPWTGVVFFLVGVYFYYKAFNQEGNDEEE